VFITGSSINEEKYILMKCFDGITGILLAMASLACCLPIKRNHSLKYMEIL
jgi:hypothetical protein